MKLKVRFVSSSGKDPKVLKDIDGIIEYAGFLWFQDAKKEVRYAARAIDIDWIENIEDVETPNEVS